MNKYFNTSEDSVQGYTVELITEKSQSNCMSTINSAVMYSSFSVLNSFISSVLQCMKFLFSSTICFLRSTTNCLTKDSKSQILTNLTGLHSDVVGGEWL